MQLTRDSKPFRVYAHNASEMMDMGKMYAGNMPQPGEGWNQLGQCNDVDDVQWFVFSKSQDHSPEWMTIKIVANGKAKSKANYWLVRNMQTGQIGFARDYVLMRENRPELHQQIENLLKGA